MLNRLKYTCIVLVPLFFACQIKQEAEPNKSQEGVLEKSKIAKVISSKLGNIKFCYEKELVRNSKLQGKVVVDFVIGLDGKVSSAKIIESTINQPKIDTCVQKVVQRMLFPKPKGGIVNVVYPFSFSIAEPTTTD